MEITCHGSYFLPGIRSTLAMLYKDYMEGKLTAETLEKNKAVLDEYMAIGRSTGENQTETNLIHVYNINMNILLTK